MKVGIIGGIGPESTVEYYKSIITGYQRRMRDDNYPEIVIDSINMKEMLSYVAKRDWESLVQMLMKSISSLTQVGADFAVIASNTPHVVFDRVRQIAKIPLLSIVEETCKKAETINCKRLGLLGTGFTMRENFYHDTFLAHNMEIVLPNIDEQQYIHQKLFSEIELGIVKKETKYGLLSIIDRMVEEEFIDSLILGCTELPLILMEGDSSIPYFNTAEIHINSIIDRITSSNTLK